MLATVSRVTSVGLLAVSLGAVTGCASEYAGIPPFPPDEELAHACAAGRGAACTKYGAQFETSNFQRVDEIAEWFRRGCELGDPDGCDRYADMQAYRLKNLDQARWAYERSCKAGRRGACHQLGKVLLENPSQRAAAAALLESNCAQGFSLSCTLGAIAVAPLLGPESDCRRAAPLAEKTCRSSREASACAIRDACQLADESQRADALARLRLACDRRVPFACLYWADAQGDASADPEKVTGAYEIACHAQYREAEVACPRLVALELAAVSTPSQAEQPLRFLKKACEASLGAACCALGDVYESGRLVEADPAQGKALKTKACHLGDSRCCAPKASTAP
jgi:TPR repeat protein